MTKHQYQTMIACAERDEPTRARRVTRVTDAVDGVTFKNRSQRRQKRTRGHPARSTSLERRRKHVTNPKLKKSEDFHAQLRKCLIRAADDDGMYAGVLGVVAAHAVEQLLLDFDLDPDEHRYALTCWITGMFGYVLREPNVDGYLRWRETGRQQAIG